MQPFYTMLETPVIQNKRDLRRSLQSRDAQEYKPDPKLSRQQRRLAERVAAKERAKVNQ